MNNLKELEITCVIQLCLKTLTDAEVVQPALPSSNPLYLHARLDILPVFLEYLAFETQASTPWRDFVRILR